MDRHTLEAIKAHHARFVADVEKEVRFLKDKEMPELTEELFALYEQTGNRLIYEEKYFERRKFFVAYSLYCCWHRSRRELERLEAILLELCRETTWALPAHVDRSTEGWENTVDLFAAETAQGLAHVLHLLGDSLHSETVRRVKEEILRRVLRSYIDTPYGFWRFENMENNWAAVCLGCLGSAALYACDDAALTEQILARIEVYLPKYLAGMCEDGTCPEGVSYFTYGMVFYTGYARQLFSHTEGQIDLMAGEKMEKIARFQQAVYLPGGVTVSFSDGSRRDAFRLGLTAYLYGRIPGVSIPDIGSAMHFHSDHCYRFLANYQDDVWVRELIEQEEARQKETEKNTSEAGASLNGEGPVPEFKASGKDFLSAQSGLMDFTVLPDAQWAIWKKDEVGIAFKGGHNDEPHNQNDVGSFLFAADGEIFLTDLGSGEYTKDYFEPDRRYQILCNRSFGHSVPILQGREQAAGNAYRADSFTFDRAGWAEISFSGAYGMGKETRLTRRAESPGTEKGLRITDTLTVIDALPSSEASFEENLVTQIRPRLEGSRILLEGEKGDVSLTVEGLRGDVSVIEEVFRNHSGKDEPVWLIRFAVNTEGGRGTCRIRAEYRRK